MKPITVVVIPMLLALPLMGAKCSEEAKASVECGAEGCTKKGEISGRWEFKRSSDAVHDVLFSGENFDAAQWRVSLSGSNVAMPAYGTVLLRLVDSSTGSTSATRNFGWYRSGNDLLLSSPDEVNTWAAAQAGSADSIRYETAPFHTSESAGVNNLTMSDVYDSEQLTYTRFSWRSDSYCPKRLDRQGRQVIACP